VHGDVSIAKHFFGCVVFGIAWSDTYIDGDRDAVSAERKRLTDTFEYPAGHLLGLADAIKVFQNYGKLVPTDACDHICRVEHTHKALCRHHQDLVAEGVAEAVVDILKLSNVQEK